MTDAEREYRAQWIRDAARDLLVARESKAPMIIPVNYGQDYDFLVGHATTVATRLWDLYVKERE